MFVASVENTLISVKDSENLALSHLLIHSKRVKWQGKPTQQLGSLLPLRQEQHEVTDESRAHRQGDFAPCWPLDRNASHTILTPQKGLILFKKKVMKRMPQLPTGLYFGVKRWTCDESPLLTPMHTQRGLGMVPGWASAVTVSGLRLHRLPKASAAPSQQEAFTSE